MEIEWGQCWGGMNWESVASWLTKDWLKDLMTSNRIIRLNWFTRRRSKITQWIGWIIAEFWIAIIVERNIGFVSYPKVRQTQGLNTTSPTIPMISERTERKFIFFCAWQVPLHSYVNLLLTSPDFNKLEGWGGHYRRKPKIYVLRPKFKVLRKRNRTL